jgi:hypothetical protein
MSRLNEALNRLAQNAQAQNQQVATVAQVMGNTVWISIDDSTLFGDTEIACWSTCGGGPSSRC